MPNLKAPEPVENYKLTKEQKAFYKVYEQINKISEMIAKGLSFQTSKLEALQGIAQDIAGKKKELMLRVPEQSVLEVEDEGMIR